MWQYLADYGTPPNIVLDNGGRFTPGIPAVLHTTPNHSLLYDPPLPSKGNSVTERSQDPEVSPLDPVSRTPSELAHVLQPCQITIIKRYTPPLDNNPTSLFFLVMPPGLLEQLYPTSRENKTTWAWPRPNPRDASENVASVQGRRKQKTEKSSGGGRSTGMGQKRDPNTRDVP
ncbi:hypothetical protein GWK47_020557 [Chionoecetes opilio]|uniref:Uncharacterized protein n=1 Tax=Chionoecetes opilio TaxID=41210 RepID=A0A8J4XPM8_CHIOP|nr:hypothetical protein GWK47_020557 [Chionoecetes opilio]